MNRILLCVDGSLYADVCARYAAWLATRCEAQVHALYVSDLRQYELPMIADLGGSLGAQPYQGLVGQLTEIEEEKSSLLEEAVRRIFGEKGLEGRLFFEHRTGLLVDAVGHAQEEKPCDLVVLGKRGEHANFATGHLGSEMERVVRSSQRPCLVSNREFREINRLLLAYDGSLAARAALEWLAVSGMFAGKEVHIVTVNEGHQEDDGVERLRGAEALLKAGDYAPVVAQMLTGEVESAISGYVEEKQIDLLLMGAYGHSRLREFFIGSTTSHLLRECLVPVMMFR